MGRYRVVDVYFDEKNYKILCQYCLKFNILEFIDFGYKYKYFQFIPCKRCGKIHRIREMKKVKDVKKFPEK